LKAKPAATKKASPAPDENHFVHDSVASAGLYDVLPAGFRWVFSRAAHNPTFEGEDAYHVVTVHGKPRYIRVIHATITPPPGLVYFKMDGSTPKIQALSPVDVRFGQETLLPDGVKPRPMVAAGPAPGGQFYLRLKRSGTRADPTVFHVLLKK
jgi:hypothetical protein